MKKTNKLISVLLVMAMLLSMIPLSLTVSAADTPTTTTIDGKVFYQLSTADDLYWFASQANGSNRTINGILLNDITVNTGVLESDGTLAVGSFREWAPICTNIYYPYAGIFDGNGFAISGLVNNTYADYVGLFGYVREATIKNLGIKDSFFYGDYCVGAVAGCSWSSTISNCYNTGTVNGVEHVGGVVGYNRIESTLTNSYNTGKVTGTEYIGGVVGYNYATSTLTNSYNTGNVTGTENVGGVAGISITESTVSNSYNTGNVKGGGEYIGGVVGQSGSDSKITNSHNTGDVTGNRLVGGVAGESRSSSTVTNCYNTGTVNCTGEYVGGVVGINTYSSTVTNCYNTGTVNCTVNYVGGVVAYMTASATVTNCYNVGTVNCTGNYVGGVVALMLHSATATNNYYLVTCGAAGSGTSATADQFASGYVAYHLNGGVTDGTQAFYQNIDNGKTVDAIPKLTGGTVYAKKCVDTPYGYSNSVEESLTSHTPPEGTGACADYTCTVCNEAVTTAHTPPETWDCTAGYTCTLCGTEVAAATTAHTAPEGADCTVGYDCTVCGEAVEATDHDYISVVTPPTETEEGYTTYTCSVCGHEYVLDYIAYDVKGTVASFGSEDDTVTIELVKSGETTPACTKTVVGTVAEFSLNGIEAGEYTLKVSKENHVSREYNVTVDSDLAELELKIHLKGDINGDGRVNSVDVARANAHARSVSVLSDYDLACADTNGDGKVNSVDVARMNAHARSISMLW